MQTFKNEPTAAPRIKANAQKTNSEMDDNAIKSPGSVTLPMLSPTPFMKSSFLYQARMRFQILASAAADLREGNIGGGSPCFPARSVNPDPLRHQSLSILLKLI